MPPSILLLFRRWLREPLAHFLLAGALIFGVSRIVARRTPGEEHRIVVSAGYIEGLREETQRRNGRAPTAGSAFADQVMKLAPAAWSGPIRSSYGLHLVRVSEAVGAREPALTEVRARVHEDYLAVRRTEENRRAPERLRKQYVVVIESRDPKSPAPPLRVSR